MAQRSRVRRARATRLEAGVWDRAESAGKKLEEGCGLGREVGQGGLHSQVYRVLPV